MGFCLQKISFIRISLQAVFLTCLYLSAVSVSPTYADLYITDDYLKGLDAEVEDTELSPETNKDSTAAQATTPADINKATESRFNFETLLRTKHPTSYVVYTKLSTSDRILIYDKFKDTKNVSTAKQMIINKFESR
ncbi:MAG: hypothetical protein OQK75_14320 [Gammaproteobacteria bacterium]|nr:hypothetical protein [Gammaproteobacteria bacterium]MCW8988835.1 hypothetical protein [Gammaproteobacteria bacterium]MCW9031714.1 hypothetical protein [Gammaproteobacteria bacterium]